MATANPPISEDNFILELNRVKESIVTKFREISEHLEGRKTEFLRQIDTILVSYQTYKREFQAANEKKKDLETTRLFHQNQLSNSLVKSVHDNVIALINTQLEAIETPKQPKLVSFVYDKEKLLTEVNKLCRLVERVSEIDYKSKTQSIISVCDNGTGNEQLNIPYGVKVDNKTGNIYVADYFNHCVKVFDSTAKYLLKFGDVKGEGKMSNPKELLIRGNRVFVSHNHCILAYQLDGKFVSRVGGKGNGKLQFNCPWGLSTDESNHDIYICDCNNNRIQIISENLRYRSQFGKDTLNNPSGITLYKDNIFVLDQSNPCLHVYTKDLVLQKSVITRGYRQQVIDPWFFLIDKFGYILISDLNSNSILILNLKFEFIHKISVNTPTGITMDKEDRIIVTCRVANCLQIF